MTQVTNGAGITSKSPKRMLTDMRSIATNGMMVTLENGREYYDWQMGMYGPFYGYRPQYWQDALVEAISKGPASSIAHAGEQTLAHLVTEFYPDVEAVRFMLNGSDPCSAAVKVARAVTGREKILVYGYHGTGSAYAAPPTPYDPDDNRLGTMWAERDAYINLDWLGRGGEWSKLAAVIVECPPVDGGREEATRWLNRVAEIAHGSGALFILDEVVTGFRYGPSGAARYYNLTDKVDLYCFGKNLGNGYPVAALAGKESAMQWLAEKPGGGGKVHWSNTWNGEPLGMAVAIATLTQMQINPPWEHLHSIGEYLKEQWNRLELPWKMVGHPTRPVLSGPDEKLNDLRLYAFEHGHIIIKHPWLTTVAMTTQDVDAMIEVVQSWK